MSAGFATRLQDAFGTYGHLCLGIDPHAFLVNAWGLDDTPAGIREFSLRALDACFGQVGIIKPQVAFYERFGSAGYTVLEELNRRARSADMLVIADAKRGDIGTTMQAYAQTWLTKGSPLESDALTITPYLGVGALESAFSLANDNEKGVFVLAATSNSEAAHLQRARTEHDNSVARDVLDDVSARSMEARDPGSFGVVLGATLRLEQFGIETADTYPLPVLAPGFGAQGAAVADASRLFGSLAQNLIVAQTRSILEAGPDRVHEVLKREANETADALA